MRGLSVVGVDFRNLDLDTAIAAYLDRPGRRRSTCSRTLAEQLRQRRAARAPTRRPPASSTSTGRHPIRPTRPAAAAVAVARLVEPLEQALDARGLRALYDDDRAAAGRACWRAWRRPACASTACTSRAWSADAHRRGAAARRRDPGAGGPPVQRQLHQAAAHGPVRRARPAARRRRPRPGFSTDAAVAREAARPAPDHREAAALPRGREAALDLRREPARRGRRPTVASTPRSTRPWPAPAGCRPTRPNLHNIPVRTEEGRQFRRAFIPADGCELLVADYNQIELRVHRPPGRGPRPDRGVHRPAPTSTPPPRRACSASSRRDVTVGAAVEGEDGLVRPGLRHGVLRAGPAPRHPGRGGGGDPRRLLRGLPQREGLHGPHGRARRASGATPRRCSAAAARSPSCRRTTSASARRASARP